MTRRFCINEQIQNTWSGILTSHVARMHQVHVDLPVIITGLRWDKLLNTILNVYTLNNNGKGVAGRVCQCKTLCHDSRGLSEVARASLFRRFE